jgi:hypothetical protein
LPRCFQIRSTDWLDGGNAAAERLPEPIRDLASNPIPKQCPRFDEDVIGRDQWLTCSEDSLGARVSRVRRVCRRVPNRRIHKQTRHSD